MKKRTAASPVVFLLDRRNSGADVITTHILKEATETGMRTVKAFALNDGNAQQKEDITLAPGLYLLTTNIDVIENVTGKYNYLLSIGGKGTYTDKGDVNVSPAPYDSDHWADDIILHVVA